MPDVEIVLDNPIMPVAPKIGYDRVATQLAVGWRPADDGSGVVYSASMTVRPYRTVPGLGLDMAPESMTQTINIGDVSEEITKGSQYGEVAGAILAILQKGLAGMGG